MLKVSLFPKKNGHLSMLYLRSYNKFYIKIKIPGILSLFIAKNYKDPKSLIKDIECLYLGGDQHKVKGFNLKFRKFYYDVEIFYKKKYEEKTKHFVLYILWLAGILGISTQIEKASIKPITITNADDVYYFYPVMVLREYWGLWTKHLGYHYFVLINNPDFDDEENVQKGFLMSQKDFYNFYRKKFIANVMFA